MSGALDAEKRALVVALREVQSLLDDAAHDLPEGRYTTEQQVELANTLEALAALVRRRARHVVLDVADTAAE